MEEEKTMITKIIQGVSETEHFPVSDFPNYDFFTEIFNSMKSHNCTTMIFNLKGGEIIFNSKQ